MAKGDDSDRVREGLELSQGIWLGPRGGRQKTIGDSLSKLKEAQDLVSKNLAEIRPLTWALTRDQTIILSNGILISVILF